MFGFGDAVFATSTGTGINTSAIPVMQPTAAQAAAVNDVSQMPLSLSTYETNLAAQVPTYTAAQIAALPNTAACPSGYTCSILPSLGIPDMAVYGFGAVVLLILFSSLGGGRRR